MRISLTARPSPHARTLQIEAEQTGLLYSQAPVGFAVTLVNASIVAFLLRGVVPLPVLGAWLALLVMVTLARALLVRRYRLSPPLPEQHRYWRALFIIGTGVAGGTWGTTGIFMFPTNSSVHLLLLAFVLGGMAAGAVVALSSVRLAFAAFAIPTLLPIILHFFLEKHEVLFGMGILLLIFLAALLALSHNLHASTQESLTLRFERGDLLQDLQHQATTLTDMNNALQEEISVRKQTEAALTSSEERLRVIFEHAPDGLYLSDSYGCFLDSNRAAEDMIGYAKAHLIGKNFLELDLLSPEQLSKAAALLMKNQQGQPTGPDEFLLKRQDGSFVPLEIVTYPVQLDGQLVVLGVARDVTVRKQAEEALHAAYDELELRVQERTAELVQVNAALQAAEQDYRALFENTLEGIYRSTLDGRQLRANPALVKLNGYESEEEMLPAVNDIALEWYVDPGRRAEFSRILERAGQVTGFESEVYRHKTRERIWISETARLVRSPEGKALYYEGTVQDITARKEAEERQRQLQGQLLQSQKLEAVGTLAGGIAHDFNNILAIIIGFGELLKNSVAEGMAGRKNLEYVLTAAYRARDLVQQLLAFGRPSSNVFRPIDLQRVIVESLELLRAVLPRTVELRSHIEPHGKGVIADPAQMQQVLMNLGMNAIHAMKDTGGVLDVQARCTEIAGAFASVHPPLKPGAHYQITVRDSGCGMTAEVLERIFDPFFTTKPIGEGTGLGLSVVHGIVQAHGGAMTVESVLGHGATFTLYVPLVTPELTMEESAPVSTRP
jgi:PAS domain S-box-containing protein